MASDERDLGVRPRHPFGQPAQPPENFETDGPTQIQRNPDRTTIEKSTTHVPPGDIIDVENEREGAFNYTQIAEQPSSPSPSATATQPDDLQVVLQDANNVRSAEWLESFLQSRSSVRFGHYWVLDPIGAGGMAEVHLAYETLPTGDARPCVVKCIAQHSLTRRDYLEMFDEEGRIGELLVHRNIVRQYDSGEVDGVPYICFELVDGITAADVLKLEPKSRTTPAVVLHIAREMLEALSYAHELRDPDGKPLNLIHRDVSPTNILISRNTGSVKLADFGIARFEGRFHQTRSGHFKGKMRYIAPEQLKNVPLDGRVDLFALGVVMAEMLIGGPIFVQGAVLCEDPEAEMQSKLQAPGLNLPADLVEFILTLTRTERDERPADAATALDLLPDISTLSTHEQDVQVYLQKICARVPGLEKRAIARASTAMYNSVKPPPYADSERPPIDGLTSGALSTLYAVLLQSVLDSDEEDTEHPTEAPAVPRAEGTRKVHIPEIQPPTPQVVVTAALDDEDATVLPARSDTPIIRPRLPPEPSISTRVFAVAAAIVLLTMVVALVLSRL